jgi:hypothetical protein
MSLTKVYNRMIEGQPLNVVGFGADPTGVSDSASAIQAAIDYSEANSVIVEFPVGGTFLINSGLTITGSCHIRGNKSIIRKNFDGVGITITGGAAFNTIEDLYLYGYGDGLADSSAANSSHGFSINSNRVRLKNVISSSNRGHGFAIVASSPNMNRSEWGMGGWVDASSNDGDGFNFSGTNDNTSIWNHLFFLSRQNQGLGIRCSDDWMGRQWKGFMYLEDNAQGGGYTTTSGEVTANYFGKLRYCDLYVYAEENEAGITKDASFGSNTQENNIVPSRMNRWEDLGSDNKLSRGLREQKWGATPRMRWLRGINVTSGSEYMSEKFTGSSGAGDLGEIKWYGDGVFEQMQRKTSNGKQQYWKLEFPSTIHEVYDALGIASEATRLARGTYDTPTAAQVGDYANASYAQAYDGSAFANITLHASEVYNLGSGDPGGKHLFSVMQAGSNTLKDVMSINYDSVVPEATSGTISLGASGALWSEVFASTATINTSDQNLKQQINSLTTAEQAVATAIKGLIKTYKFNDAVAAKGDNARIHVGVIAQDVKAAFEAQGLDANNYGLFCKDTWWEADIEVANPDYDPNDENSPSRVTRTRRFPDEASAPDGAIEKTQLAIRYEELLAFVIAAL